jgi:hypothetical protein
LDELTPLLPERGRWPEAHKLFQRVRQKTLAARSQQKSLFEAQYLFEEVCAKTLTTSVVHQRPSMRQEILIFRRDADHAVGNARRDDGDLAGGNFDVFELGN